MSDGFGGGGSSECRPVRRQPDPPIVHQSTGRLTNQPPPLSVARDTPPCISAGFNEVSEPGTTQPLARGLARTVPNRKGELQRQ